MVLLWDGRTYRVVTLQLELQLYGLLETLEAPVTLLLLHGGDSQELLDGIIGLRGLDLLGIVVLILNVDVARVVLALICIRELKVILLVRLLHEIIVRHDG